MGPRLDALLGRPSGSPDPNRLSPAPRSPLPAGREALRLLLVAYYMPPSGGAGVQRPTKWAKYLPAAGVEVSVLTVRAGAYPHLDPAMAADLAPGTAVVRTPAPDPFGLYGRLTGRSREAAVAARTGRVGASEALPERVARALRANVFVPDARVGWVPFARRAARRMLRAAAEAGRPFDAVLTTGPPHSAHLVGRALRRGGLPWIADFRDPWSDIHYVEALGRTRAAQALDERLEAAVLREADAVLTVSDPLRDALEARAGRTVLTVRNGFDPDDFRAAPAPVATDAFEAAYVGTLYGVPEGLLDALAAVRAEGVPARLRVVGSAPEGLREAAEARGLGADAVSAEPAVGHAEAVRAMQSAGLLVATVEAGWRYAAAVVPGKLFEYLAAGRPVLLVGPAGEAADILADAQAGERRDASDVPGIADALRAHAAAWAAGTPRAGADPARLAPYRRDVQAADVARVVREVATKDARGPRR